MTRLAFAHQLDAVGYYSADDRCCLLAMKAMMATFMNLRRRVQFLGFSSSSLEKSMIWALIRCGPVSMMC